MYLIAVMPTCIELKFTLNKGGNKCHNYQEDQDFDLEWTATLAGWELSKFSNNEDKENLLEYINKPKPVTSWPSNNEANKSGGPDNSRNWYANFGDFLCSSLYVSSLDHWTEFRSQQQLGENFMVNDIAN